MEKYDILIKLSREQRKSLESDKKLQKSLKKGLTNETGRDIINKLSQNSGFQKTARKCRDLEWDLEN